MALYVVTGAAGFIGSHIVEALVARGEAVRAVDNFVTGRRENLAPFRDRIECVEGDLADADVAAAAVRDATFVLHQAAIPSVPRSIEDPLTSHRANVVATLRVLLAARDAGVRRFVHASSSSIYGDAPVLPKREEMPPRPLSPYAVQKLAAEGYCRLFSTLYGLETVALRYFNVFGPRQHPTSPYSGVITKFVRAFLADASPEIYGDGEQTRDFTYVANVVEANLQALVAPAVAGEVFNIGAGAQVTVNAMAAALRALTGARASARHAASQPGDIRHSHADISRAQQRLGYRVLVPFEEGLRRTVEWYREAAAREGLYERARA